MKVEYVRHYRAIHVFWEGELCKKIYSAFYRDPDEWPMDIGEIDKKKFLQRLYQVEQKKALIYAIRLLSNGNIPVESLRVKLKAKYVAPENIDQIIAYCQSKKYLDDTSWAATFVERQIQKKVSRSAIRYKLVCKGIGEEVIDTIFQSIPWDEIEEEEILYWVQKKQNGGVLVNIKERQKLKRQLVHKGFSIEKIIQVLNN